jgi:hypothetical protein
MFRRCCLALLAVLLARPAVAQVIEVQVRSIDDVLAAAHYLVPLVGEEDLLQPLDMILEEPGGKGLSNVIDKKRPFGVTMEWPADSKTPDSGVIYVPLRNAKTFPADVKKLALPWRLDKGLYEIKLPLGIVLFGRPAGDHIFLSMSRDLLADKARLQVPKTQPTALVRAVVHVPRLPPFVLKMFRDAVEEQLVGDNTKPLPGEPEALQRRRVLQQAQRAFFAALIERTRALSVTLDVDVKKPRLVVEGALVPEPGTPFAESIKSFGAGRSLFRALHRQAIVSLSARLPVGLGFDLQEASAALLDKVEKTVDPQERLFAGRLLRALEPTFKHNVFDAGAALYAPDAEHPLRVLAGLHIQKGRALENLVRDLIKDASAGERAYYGLQWRHRRHGDALVHSLLWQARSDKVRPMFFTVRQELALAGTELGDVTRALDDFGRPVPDDDAPVHLAVHLKALTLPYYLVRMEQGDAKGFQALLDDLNRGDFPAAIDALQRFIGSPRGKAAARDFAKTFPKADEDDRRIRLTVRGDTALRLRLEVHPELLRLIPLLAADEKAP